MAFTVKTLLATGSVIASQTGTAVSLAKAERPLTGSEGYNNRISVGLQATVAGVGSVAPVVQGKYGDNWQTLTPNAAWTACTSVTDGSGVRTFVGPVPIEVRGVFTLTSTATFDATMTVIGIDNG